MSSFFPKKKILSILAKDSLNIEIENETFSVMRYFLEYFIRGCRKLKFVSWENKNAQTQNICKTFQNCKCIIEYTIVTLFVNSIPAQLAVYQKFLRKAPESFIIIIKISVNHFQDFHKIFSRGWVVFIRPREVYVKKFNKSFAIAYFRDLVGSWIKLSRFPLSVLSNALSFVNLVWFW